ncbi:MAG TPA: KH domain-containing protein [Clostridiales bacterium]|nr:KH domain-containing protein [Clostridiales bacterium]
MKELLYSIIEGLVENKADICITEDAPNEEGIVVMHLNVAKEDMGRVIGKQGRIAKAMRTIMRAGAARKDLKVMVEIEEA